MRYINHGFMLALMLLFLSGCGPRYVIQNQYIPPMQSSSKGCLEQCTFDRQSCESQCQTRYQVCLDSAFAKAKTIHEEELRLFDVAYHRYTLDLTHFNAQLRGWEMEYHSYSRDLAHFHSRCEKYKDSYACTRRDDLRAQMSRMKHLRPKEPWIPVRPIFEEILVNQQSFCTTNCGCNEAYDSCFLGCGGEIIPHKICVENCEQ